MTERRRWTPTRTWAWWPAVVLAGCTLGPDYKRPELPLSSQWRLEHREAEHLVDSEWWQGFADPALARLIDRAIDANRDLKLAALRIEQLQAVLKVSKSAAYPQAGFSGGAGYERRSQERPNGLTPGSSPNLNDFEGGLQVSWELDLWGRVRRSNEAALADLLSAQESRRGIMLTVVADLATAYLELVELDARVAVARERVANRRRFLELTQLRQEGGSATLMVVEEARIMVEAESAEIPLLERDIDRLENAISSLLGQPSGRIERQPLAALSLPRMPAGVPADVLGRRPDVAAAEQNLVAANARIGVAMTDYLPRLSLTAAFGLGADDPRWFLAKTARTGSVLSSVLGPLYTAGRVEGTVANAEAVQKQMVVEFQKAVQTALREVEDALSWRRRSDEREAVLDRQLGSTRRLAEQVRLRFDGGRSTRLDVLDSELNVLGVEASRARSRRDTGLALVAMYRAMGGGWMLEQERKRSAEPPIEGARAQAAGPGVIR